jgi:plasmid replication initiation protein
MPETGSLWDERIIAAIAGRNRTDEIEFREHIVDVKELSTPDGLSTSQYREIKKAITRLTRSYFQVLRRNGNFMNYPIFAKIGLEDGSVTGKFNPDLKEHYLELRKQFAMRSLPEFQALSSTYSQKLYRYLNSWRNEPETTVSLAELHETLATPPSFRKNFKSLRIRVLEVAHREINAETGLEFDWEPVKEGKRKVVAVRFIFDIRAARSAARKAALAVVIKPKRSPEDEEIDRLQAASNECFKKFYERIGKDCAPKKRSKRCQYCLERGRMGIRARVARQKELNLEGSGTK